MCVYQILQEDFVFKIKSPAMTRDELLFNFPYSQNKAANKVQ